MPPGGSKALLTQQLSISQRSTGLLPHCRSQLKEHRELVQTPRSDALQRWYANRDHMGAIPSSTLCLLPSQPAPCGPPRAAFTPPVGLPGTQRWQQTSFGHPSEGLLGGPNDRLSQEVTPLQHGSRGAGQCQAGRSLEGGVGRTQGSRRALSLRYTSASAFTVQACWH